MAIVGLGTREYGGHVVVALHGELDVAGAESVTAVLTAAVAGNPRIVVDLAALDYIDCYALSVLGAVRAQARRAGGDLLLAAPRGLVRRVLDLTGVFAVHASVDKAVRAAGGEPDRRQHVEVSDDDRTVATAEVTTSEGSGGTARVSLRAEPGHISPGRRASLVDALLDLPQVQESARLEAAFRLGDGESLHRLQERCQDVSTRPAGWSTLLDANLPSRRAGQHAFGSAGKKPPHGA